MQTSVSDSLTKGLPGQLADIANNEIVCAANYSKQLFKVTISADDTTTVVTINGTAFTFTETGASELKAYIAEYLAGLVNASSLPVTAYYTATNDYFTVESNTPGTAITVVGTTSCVALELIGNAADIDFGLLVVRDIMNENKARVPIVATDITTSGNVFGITVNTHVENNYQLSGSPGYALDSPMSIMRKGRIYVEVEDAVVQGGVVYVRFSASGTEKLGAFRSDADTADAAILPNAIFETSAAAGEIAIVSINFP